jgi:hypothetical protein
MISMLPFRHPTVHIECRPSLNLQNISQMYPDTLLLSSSVTWSHAHGPNPQPWPADVSGLMPCPCHSMPSIPWGLCAPSSSLAPFQTQPGVQPGPWSVCSYAHTQKSHIVSPQPVGAASASPLLPATTQWCVGVPRMIPAAKLLDFI